MLSAVKIFGDFPDESVTINEMVATEVKIVCNQAPVTASRGNFRQGILGSLTPQGSVAPSEPFRSARTITCEPPITLSHEPTIESPLHVSRSIYRLLLVT